MGEFDIDVSELEAYATRLRQISNAGSTAFAGITQKYGFLTKREAQRLAPFKTGELLGSIRQKRNSTSGRFTSSEWEVTAPHASPQEYGFMHKRGKYFVQAANGGQGYVRPALKKYRKPYIEEMASAAKDQFSTLKKVSRSTFNNVDQL